jgi:hypothetical protein
MFGWMQPYRPQFSDDEGERPREGTPPLDEDFGRSKTLNVRFVVVAMVSKLSTRDGNKRGLLQGSLNIGGGRRGVK